MSYFTKYLKYKNKYLNLKIQFGGELTDNEFQKLIKNKKDEARTHFSGASAYEMIYINKSMENLDTLEKKTISWLKEHANEKVVFEPTDQYTHNNKKDITWNELVKQELGVKYNIVP